MSSIDERVVRMMFDNTEFERGIQTSLASLAQLQKGIQLPGASRGLDDIGEASKRLNFDHMAQGIDSIKSKFSAMSVVALTALTNITNKIVNAGLSLAKSLTIAPITSGLSEYETKLGSIQTILANTGLEGKKGLETVTKALNNLNTYSDKTIYNFGEMAKNIGTFTAAGVDLDTSVNAIKGIANLAAVSGSSAEQASGAMYQLSQALSTGTLKLQDWNSVTAAGMGGKVFQENLKETARVHGVAVDKIISEEGSFRDSLQKGWITTDILTESLSKMTGDLTDQQLKSMGYTDKQIIAIQKMAKTASDAATKVKTFSQLISTLQETAGSGWAQTWELLFGNFDEAKNLFTNINNVIGGFIGASAEARNKVIGDWKALGGRTAVIDGISNAFHALIAVIKPIRDAFREIFPAQTGKDLYAMSVAFRDFTEGLKIGANTAEKIRSTFSGVFAVFKIAKGIIVEIVKLFARLFGSVTEGNSSILDSTASWGEWLKGISHVLIEGGKLHDFFTKIGDVIEKMLAPIKKVASVVKDLFGNVDFGALGDSLKRILAPIGELSGVGDLVKSAWEGVGDVFSKVWEKLKDLIGNIGGGGDSMGIGHAISTGFSGIDADGILSVIGTGFIAVIALSIKKLFKGIRDAISGAGGETTSFLDPIRESFDQLTGSLKAMQTALNAGALLAIAIAIGILTLSVVALSKIDAEGLTKALTAITVMAAQLATTMLILSRFQTGGTLRLIVIGAAMVLLAIAVNILATAVKKLADLEWEELAKGLTGVTVLIVALSASTQLMSGNTGKMVATGLALILLATAIRLLVDAVKVLSDMSWEELLKGIGSVALLLGALGLFTKFAEANAGGISQGAGLLLLAIGIKVLAEAVGVFGQMSVGELTKGLGTITAILAAFSLFATTSGNPFAMIASGFALTKIAAGMIIMATAVNKFGDMSWNEIAKSLIVMAGSMIILTASLKALSGSTLGAAALLTIAPALLIMAGALRVMGGMSWEEIGKGLTVLATSLVVIATALMFMTGALPGAAALLLVAASLAVLAPILILLGSMSWASVAVGLTVLAGALLIIGAAGILLGPAAIGLLALGASVVMLGAGLFLAGTGVTLLATGLAVLAATGYAAVNVIIGFLKGLIGMLPEIATQLGKALIAFIKVIATAGPAIFKAISTVLIAFLDAIIKAAPKAGEALLKVIDTILKVLVTATPKITAAAIKIVISFLEEVTKGIPKFAKAATDMIVAFLKALGDSIPKIVDAGFKMIIDLINGISDAIDKNAEELGKAGGRLAGAIVKGMVKGILAGVGEIGKAAGDLGMSAIHSIGDALGISSPSLEFQKIGQFAVLGFVKGLKGSRPEVFRAFSDMTGLLTTAMNSTSTAVVQAKENLRLLTEARNADTQAIARAKAVVAQAKAYQKEGPNLNEYTERIKSLTAARKRDADAIVVAQAALDKAKLDPSKTAEVAKYTKQIQDLTAARKEDANTIKFVESEIAKAKVQFQKTSAADIVQAQENLRILREARKQDVKAIALAEAALVKANAEHKKAAEIYALEIKLTAQYRTKLAGLAAQQDILTAKLITAKNVLVDTKRTRDDFNKSTQESFSVLPDLSGNTSLVQYQAILRKQIDQTRVFGTSIQKLRDLGLNDELYRELLAKGTSALPFVTNLLTGGKAEVDKLNNMSKELDSAASRIGNSASKQLYQAAVDSARGIVEGLKAQQGAISIEMNKIADAMVKAIKSKLGIKSPSSVFASVGQEAAQGLSDGLNGYAQVVEKAAENVGKSAILAMSKSISGMSDLITSDIDMTPTITPILDLSLVQKDAGLLTTMFPDTPISVDAAYSTAQNASAGLRNNQQSLLEAATATGTSPSSVTYIQNNTSPKALSQVEIYRQTKNQLSTAKGAVTK